MRLRRILVWGGLLSLLSACSLMPTVPRAPRVLDFGPPPIHPYHAATFPPLVFAGLEASASVAGVGIHYRLLYRHPHELRRYPGALWLAPPARLMDARLKSRLAALSQTGVPRYVLVLTLVAWEQDWISPASARDRVLIDATLTRPLDQDWQTRHIFRLSRRTAPGVSGAVAGFAALDHAFDQALTAWIARETRSRHPGRNRPHSGISTRSH
ncbi:MAG: hypothetical protein ACYCS1_07725 [Gammaproteobacteria bacterium]